MNDGGVKVVCGNGLAGVNKLHVLRCNGETPDDSTQHLVVYFGGDDISAVTAAYSVTPTDVARELQRAFRNRPFSTLVIVCPSRYEAGFACYDNFLPHEPWDVNGCHGLGTYSNSDSAFKACRQLYGLMELVGCVDTTTWTLVGFSKGGLVLNQLLVELGDLASVTRQPERQRERQREVGLVEFYERLGAVHFLDVGNHLHKGVYVGFKASARRALETVRAYVHVTERQVRLLRDFPVMRQELRVFVESFGPNCEVTVYDTFREPGTDGTGAPGDQARLMPPPRRPGPLLDVVLDAVPSARVVNVKDARAPTQTGKDAEAERLLVIHCKILEFFSV